MRVLGIDPGFDRCGFALVEGAGRDATLLHSICITTSKKDAYAERIMRVGNAFAGMLDEWKPECVAIEEVFFQANKKTAMRVAEMCGALVYIAARGGIPATNINPGDIKMTVTGYGRADKKQVQEMVRRTLGLPTPPRVDDEVDAIAVALTAYYQRVNSLSTKSADSR